MPELKRKVTTTTASFLLINLLCFFFVVLACAVLVAFSGFKDSDPVYSNKAKEQLINHVTQLGGDVVYDAEFTPQITHVVTPPSCRTMKTLAAALTHRWLVSPTWVLDSATHGSFLPPQKYVPQHSLFACYHDDLVNSSFIAVMVKSSRRLYLKG